MKFRSTGLLLVLSVSLSARADQIVLPVAIYALGPGLTNWSTEIRATNNSDSPLSFNVVDFTGVPALPFKPSAVQVQPHQTVSLGAWSLLSVNPGCNGVGLGGAYFGAFTIERDPHLLIQAAVLAGVFSQTPGGPASCNWEICPSWQGGFPHIPPNSAYCNDGAGPIFDNDRDFFAAGTPITLPWLHTQDTRRTNITFYNPDPVEAAVSLTITPADGTSGVTQSITVPAHGVLQINNVFSAPPFDAVRAHNASTTAAASARISSTTRLYAIAWIIANLNSTVSVSQPR
ncbi:MAG TPA: hypothetical protein VMN04_00195 [Thermoanaerobaculia bacterium]|nr:hypothetical protein [Thermoanaerobaculia bacterium]